MRILKSWMMAFGLCVPFVLSVAPRAGAQDAPANKAGIFARDGLDLDSHAPLLRTLTDLLVPHALSETHGRGCEGLDKIAGKILAGKKLAPPRACGRTNCTAPDEIIQAGRY